MELHAIIRNNTRRFYILLTSFSLMVSFKTIGMCHSWRADIIPIKIPVLTWVLVCLSEPFPSSSSPCAPGNSHHYCDLGILATLGNYRRNKTVGPSPSSQFSGDLSRLSRWLLINTTEFHHGAEQSVYRLPDGGPLCVALGHYHTESHGHINVWVLTRARVQLLSCVVRCSAFLSHVHQSFLEDIQFLISISCVHSSHCHAALPARPLCGSVLLC